MSLAFYQCSKEEKPVKDIVRVNNAILTEAELDSALGDLKNHGKYREEYIREWIETEVLYQEAVDDGILENDEYKTILEQSRKKLAATLFLDKQLTENEFEPTNDELLTYFEEFKDDFHLDEDAYKLNLAEFNNFERAVQFRSILMESGWKKSINAFYNDESLTCKSNDTIINANRIFPLTLYKTINNLEPNEISLVLETEPFKFIVVQLLEKLNKGGIPPFQAVSEKVKNQYLVLKHKEFARNLIDKLVEDHNVEIKRYYE